MLQRPAHAEPMSASDDVLKAWLVQSAEVGQAVAG
jgi:hypothetical protein